MKEIDWSSLSFGYMKTDYNVRCWYRNGAWGEIEISSEETLNIHMAATCLHYGQEAFEGLKAYRCPDGKVRVFRMDENAARLQSSCRGIMMPELPIEKFEEMVTKVVRLNEAYIPPYESGASLYIRPLLIGTGAQVGFTLQAKYAVLAAKARAQGKNTTPQGLEIFARSAFYPCRPRAALPSRCKKFGAGLRPSHY